MCVERLHPGTAKRLRLVAAVIPTSTSYSAMAWPTYDTLSSSRLDSWALYRSDTVDGLEYANVEHPSIGQRILYVCLLLANVLAVVRRGIQYRWI